MGGNALSPGLTGRISRSQFDEISRTVVSAINSHSCVAEVVPAYSQKPDFGDIDIVYARPGPTKDSRRPFSIEEIKKLFSPNEIFVNGEVISFDFLGAQVDLISVPMDDFFCAVDYFSFNDLGNLVGKLARRCGLKYGHRGLELIIRDGDYMVGQLCLSKSTAKIYQFLDLDFNRYRQGFANLDEIFHFVSKSQFYNPESYTLENLNHTAKVRDRKRETYRKFLEFGEKYSGHFFDMNTDKNALVETAIRFFDKSENFSEMMKDYALKKMAKSIYNGGVVSTLTGLTGKELGEYMSKNKIDPEIVLLLGPAGVEKGS